MNKIQWKKVESGEVAAFLGLTLAVLDAGDTSFTASLSGNGSRRPEYQKGFKTIQEAREYVEGVLLKRELARVGIHNTLQSIVDWFALAKPNPTPQDTATQMACHFEEIGEMVETLFLHDDGALGRLVMQHLNYPSDSTEQPCPPDQRVHLLDALCDQIVTAMGVGYMMGFDMVAAVAEVNRSNWTKFERGRPVFNHAGKVMKGADYSPPKLTPFLGAGDGGEA